MAAQAHRIGVEPSLGEVVEKVVFPHPGADVDAVDEKH